MAKRSIEATLERACATIFGAALALIVRDVAARIFGEESAGILRDGCALLAVFVFALLLAVWRMRDV